MQNNSLCFWWNNVEQCLQPKATFWYCFGTICTVFDAWKMFLMQYTCSCTWKTIWEHTHAQKTYWCWKKWINKLQHVPFFLGKQECSLILQQLKHLSGASGRSSSKTAERHSYVVLGSTLECTPWWLPIYAIKLNMTYLRLEWV